MYVRLARKRKRTFYQEQKVQKNDLSLYSDVESKCAIAKIIQFFDAAQMLFISFYNNILYTYNKNFLQLDFSSLFYQKKKKKKEKHICSLLYNMSLFFSQEEWVFYSYYIHLYRTLF